MKCEYIIDPLCTEFCLLIQKFDFDLVHDTIDNNTTRVYSVLYVVVLSFDKRI